MGSKKERRAKFLAEHPFCCFCGGTVASAEIDHIPSRALFKDRQWPEGYEFPACVRCNRATRYDEQIVSMLSRLYPDASTPREQEEIEALMREIAQHRPKIFAEMKPTVRQLRTAAKKYGLEPVAGEPITSIPVLSVSGPHINNAVENFARKLFTALYYKHACKILSSNGGIAVRWFANLQVEADEIPKSLADVLPHFPKIERSRTNLDDQFFYKYGVADTKDVAAFLAIFRRSFAIVGYVHQRVIEMHLPDKARILRPYSAHQGIEADVRSACV